MKKLKPSQIISGVLGILVVLPIWYFLMYKILQAVNATELMWFLYWVYVAASWITHFLVQLTKQDE